MAPATRPDHHLNFSYLPQFSHHNPQSGPSTGASSPVEPPPGNSMKSPFGTANGLVNSGLSPNNARLGAGSPSHELGGRLYSKRAREIQAQEGLTPNPWGPPTSGGSTPLRENIPESPSQDGFPDFVPSTDNDIQSPARRARAGTVPSRFSPVGVLSGSNLLQSLLPKTSRPTPSTSPFKPPSLSAIDPGNSAANSALLSRLRAGSMPQHTSYLGQSNPFGPSLFSTNWGQGRERANTSTSIRSSDGPSSPAQYSFAKDGLADADVRTLDYLGLAETPQQTRATLAAPTMDSLSAMQPFLTDLDGLNKSLNRFRSYSVNAKEKYADDEEEELQLGDRYSAHHSGSLTPSAATAAAALAATQAQIHQHNLAVQAFANQASASRPRARTAGVLDSPPQRSLRNYLATPSRLDNSISAADLRMAEVREYDGLPEAVQALQLSHSDGRVRVDVMDENNLEGPTRALWLGSIPNSTTISSLQAIFSIYGPIESTRVLVYKNCGFVNFEHVESAIQAKSLLNGKEIFPGAGPVRIGYAKAPNASGNELSGQNGIFTSSSPDPHAKRQVDNGNGNVLEQSEANEHHGLNGSHPGSTGAALLVPDLPDLRVEMLQIVRDFGASEEDQERIGASIDAAIAFDHFEVEIPTISEPSHARMHDAPKLRDIRKRIDNNLCSQTEIEEIAVGMLPEIAELASDYLGNTVVQKLFEYCSESVKESMLTRIVPHLAEIGVHKNGTWAAQKIIDVAKTPNQISMIIDSLRPYTVALFLDQYGNYVLQCCLRFGYPWNNFIFETMLSRMWEVAQGRFGARAMRACLESHNATKDQQRMLASAIALHSVQLATNANGALLLTWFLDTCTFPRRRTVLAPRLVPHLVHLCTHKVAYLTVLKVINQRNEPEAREAVLKALFFSPGDKTLEDILSDQACGATLIFKVLTTPFFDEAMRSDVVQNIRNVLCRLNAAPSQGYKRLMDEVGLSARNGRADRDGQGLQGRNMSHERQRPVSQHSSGPGHMSQPKMERQYSGQYMPTIGHQQFDPQSGFPRAVDSNTMSAFEQFGLNGLNSPMFTPNPISAISPQQLQYQQALLAASSRGASPGNFYPGMAANGLGGYATPSPSMDNFRSLQSHGSPISVVPPQMSPSPMLQQSGFAPPPFSPLMGGQIMGGYQYPQQYFPQQPQPQQPHHQHIGGGRRGRR